MTTTLEKIDTRYWLTKDKDWMVERNANWPAIEKAVGHLRHRKGDVTVVKQYYLRGKMPNWEKYRDAREDMIQHLTLNLFLWMHPSNDPEVLTPLYKLYMESNLIRPVDVVAGYGEFLNHELMDATSKKALKDYPFNYMGSKNIILFRILFGDLDYARKGVLKLFEGKREKPDKHMQHVFDFLGYSHFLFLREWLMQDLDSPLMQNNLYQYEEVLEWCMTTLSAAKGKKFLESIELPVNVKGYQRALYCILHFENEREGDERRTKAMKIIRKMLDEREFIPEFKKMWEDVKAGKVEVKNPWASGSPK